MTVWPSGSPRIPPVTDEYGWRAAHPITGQRAFHYGIDLVGFTYNCSPCDGVVIFAAYNGGAGNEVRVRAANGDTFRMKHNARFLVSYGQRVSEGQAVGVMGTTGDSTGVHCHFETWPGNAYTVNPRDYMAAATGIASGGIGTPLGGPELDAGEWQRMEVLGTEIINRVLRGVWEVPISYTKADGTVVTGPAREWLVNLSNTVAAKLEGLGWSDEQVAAASKVIAEQVAEQIAIPTSDENAAATVNLQAARLQA